MSQLPPRTVASGGPSLIAAGPGPGPQKQGRFRNPIASGPPLMTDPSEKLTLSFTLDQTTTTIANTLRRCILSETRSVGFRADLTDPKDPGVVIRKNTSVIFNEMLAHRLTLVPLGVVRIDDFVPANYQCVLAVKNDRKGSSAADILHVSAGQFHVLEKQADGSFADVGEAAAAAMFPADPITGDSSLLISLRAQWNPEQPPEEVDLTAYPIVGRGRDFSGFCPVSQCTFANTRDTDPVREDQFFKDWLLAFKKIEATAEVPAPTLASYKKEWNTMAAQRCFLLDPATGEPNSFDFVIESVGIRPVRDIVAEGIKSVIDLVKPYAVAETALDTIGVTIQPADSRMDGLDLMFDGQEHTLGNLLQAIITEIYITNGGAESPISYAAYKVRHPLKREMTLRLGFRAGYQGEPKGIVRQVLVTAANQAISIFESLGRSWASLVGGDAGAGGEATVALD